MKINFAAFVLLTICLSCTTKKLTFYNPGAKLFEMSKSPCFGYCPVYHLTVYDNGLMQLQAKQNLKEPGIYIRQMSKPELKLFKSKLIDLKLSTYKDEYREPIADAPGTTVTYYVKPVKKIMTNFQFPDPFQKWTDSLDHDVINGHWEKFTDQREKQEYIVQLKEGKNIAGVLERFGEYGLMIVKRLDPANSQYWSVSALVLPGQEEIVLKKLKADVDIQDAQANKALESR